MDEREQELLEVRLATIERLLTGLLRASSAEANNLLPERIDPDADRSALRIWAEYLLLTKTPIGDPDPQGDKLRIDAVRSRFGRVPL